VWLSCPCLTGVCPHRAPATRRKRCLLNRCVLSTGTVLIVLETAVTMVALSAAYSYDKAHCTFTRRVTACCHTSLVSLENIETQLEAQLKCFCHSEGCCQIEQLLCDTYYGHPKSTATMYHEAVLTQCAAHVGPLLAASH
jgi:hypothetical protein